MTLLALCLWEAIGLASEYIPKCFESVNHEILGSTYIWINWIVRGLTVTQEKLEFSCGPTAF